MRSDRWDALGLLMQSILLAAVSINATLLGLFAPGVGWWAGLLGGVTGPVVLVIGLSYLSRREDDADVPVRTNS